jgi:hypothetical protein
MADHAGGIYGRSGGDLSDDCGSIEHPTSKFAFVRIG